jgi:hypothetical protein
MGAASESEASAGIGYPNSGLRFWLMRKEQVELKAHGPRRSARRVNGVAIDVDADGDRLVSNAGDPPYAGAEGMRLGMTGWMLKMSCVRLYGPTSKFELFCRGTLIMPATGFCVVLTRAWASDAAGAVAAGAFVSCAESRTAQRKWPPITNG